jgi:hypothetical protein
MTKNYRLLSNLEDYTTRFTNGVRVDVNKEHTELRPGMAEVIDHFTQVCAALPGIWTLSIHSSGSLYLVSDSAVIHLWRRGSDDPILKCNYRRISGTENYTHDEKPNPDFWRFSVSGSYPHPVQSGESIRTDTGPKIENSKLDRLPYAIRAITGLIPGVIKMTIDAYQQIEKINARYERAALERATVERIMQGTVYSRNYPPTRHELARGFPGVCRADLKAETTSYRSTDATLTLSDLTLENAEKILNFIATLQSQ